MRLRALLSFLLALCFCFALPAQKSLQFWAVTSNIEDVAMYRQLAAQFRQQTGIAVDVTPLAWGSFKTKYFAAMAAGLPPDVGLTNLGGPFDYGTVGGVVDLRAQFPGQIKQLESQFSPSLLPIFEVGEKLYGIPSDATTLLIYYRTDIFAKLGIPAPKTWSELNADIDKIEASNYQYYFGFIAGSQWAINIFTMPYGLPGLHFDSRGSPAVDWLNPTYQKGILEGLDLFDMHNSPGRDLGGRAIGMFASSEPGTAVPLMFDLPAVAEQIHNTQPQLEGKWAIAPWPKADDGKAFDIMGGTSYVIFQQSKLKDQAFKWLCFLNSLSVQRAMVLDHLNRGEDSDFMVSTVLGMWQPTNDGFWGQPQIQKTIDLKDALAKVLPTLGTVESLHGATDAARLEGNLIDSMQTFIDEKYSDAAQQLGLSRSQLIQAFARGQYSQQRAQLKALIQSQLAAGYAKITPQAQELLNSSAADYQQQYAKAIENYAAAEQATNALKVAKLLGAVLFVGCIASVLGFKRLRKHWLSYLFVATPLLLAGLFVFIPAATSLYLSFTKYHPVLPLSTAHWVGLGNYREVMTSGDLPDSLKRTFFFTLITIPVGVMLSLLFAFLLNNKVRFPRLWRFIYFSPLVTSVVAVALIFSQLFLGAKQGWLNSVLLKLGFVRDPIPFLTSEHSFMNCLILLAIWQGLAFSILVFLAGLQQVPAELFEAASVDGASQTRKFWNIAVPGIRPQIFFVTILGFIGGLQVFEIIYTLADKSGNADARFGPNDSGLTIVPLIYHYGFETFEMGKAAAVAYVLFFIVLVVTVIQLRIFKRGEVGA